MLLAPGWGQAGGDGGGSILTGSVRPLGRAAPLAGAVVTVLSVETGSQQVVKTDARGQFTLGPLPAGSYRLSLEVEPGIGAERQVRLGPGGTHCDLRPAPTAWRHLMAALWALPLAVLVAAAMAALSLVGRPGEPLPSAAAVTPGLPGPAEGPARATRAVLMQVGGLWLAVFILLHLLAPLAQPVDLNAAAFLSSLTMAWVTVAVIACVVMAGVPPSWLLPGMGMGLLLALGFRSWEGLPVWQSAGMGLSLLIWTTCAGMLAAWTLQRPGSLLTVALVVAVADVFNVFFGPAAAIAAGQATGWLKGWAQISLLAVPLLGSNDTVPLLGAGDFLFSALFLASARKFELGLKRTYGALLGAFVAGLVTVYLLGRAIPALLFIGGAFLLVNWRRLRLP